MPCQCDTRDKRIRHPPATVDDFPFHHFTEVSARTSLNLGILDQNWALEAIYENDEEDYEDKWEYFAPELLPKWSDVQELRLDRLRDDPLEAEATASYAFLHEGILRGYLSELGKQARPRGWDQQAKGAAAAMKASIR